MNLRKINLVAGREFSIRVKKKSFIIMTLVTPILFAALMIVPSLIMLMGDDNEERRILVVDDSGIVAPVLKNTESIRYIMSESSNVDSLKNNFDALDVYALLHVSPLDEQNNVSLTAYSNKQLNTDLKSEFSDGAQNAVRDYKLSVYNIENLDAILKDINTGVSVENFVLSKDGSEVKSVVEVNMALSYIMAFVIYMFIVMFGNMVMTSVINEKSNRIVEVIVSSVKPFDLMMGKILGVAAVAVVQFLIWIVFTAVLVLGFQSSIGKKLIMEQVASNSAATEQIVQMSEMSGMNMAQLAEAAGSSEAAEVLNAISQIDFVYIIGCFLVYFVLGYLLYASMFAAIGSAVENEADTQQLVMPVTIPLIIGFLIMLHTFRYPDSALSVWASIIPFTSPMVMLARIPFDGGVPLWELLTSMGVLLLTFLVMAYISAKIYRTGILMYGKKASWKDLMKWLKY